MNAPAPTLAEAATVIVSILSVIVEMSDDVKAAASPLDAQGKLLRMQNSIQKNALRITPYLMVIMKAIEVERAVKS